MFAYAHSHILPQIHTLIPINIHSQLSIGLCEFDFHFHNQVPDDLQ